MNAAAPAGQRRPVGVRRRLQPGEEIDALVVEGGGTKGSAYPGVVLALEEAGVMKNCKKFAGSSAGAQTAALVAVADA